MSGIISFSERASAPSSPAAGKWNIYSTSDGFSIQDSTGGTGLLPILSGNATDFLNGTGAWSEPGGSSTDLTNHTHSSTDEGGLIRLDTITAPTDSTSLDSSTDMHGLLPKLNGTSDNYLNGIGEWASITAGGTTDHAALGNLDYASAGHTGFLAAASSPNRNGIINGSFRVSQRGTTFTSATTPANDDDTYLLDRWILQSDSSDIVDVSQEQSSDIANPAYNIKLDIETANKKFGILTVLEYRDSRQFTNQAVSLSFKAKRTGTTIGAIRAAILSWSGVADTITSNIVTSSTDWEAAGTNPILAANWNYENTPAALTAITTSWQTYKIENITIDSANTANVGVFIWTDDTAMDAGDFLHIADVQLEIGSVATPFEVGAYADELARCQRYYYRSLIGSYTTFAWVYVLGDGVTFVGGFNLSVPMRLYTAVTFTKSAATDFYIGGSYQVSDINGLTSGMSAGNLVKWVGTAASSSATFKDLAVADSTTAWIAWESEL
jgi:hypothetical protein